MYPYRRKKKRIEQQQQMASHKDDEFSPAAAAASLYIIHSSIAYSTCMTGRPPLRRRILYKAGDAQSSENCIEKCRNWSRVDWKKIAIQSKSCCRKTFVHGPSIAVRATK
jgi:hypothetical protein